MDSSKWYGRPGDHGGDGEAKQGVFLLLGVGVVFAVLLLWSHFRVGMSSLPSLPAAGVENSSPVSTAVPVVDGTLHYLNCIDDRGELWRASYRQSELSGPGSPYAATSQAICGDPLRRVPSE